MINETKSWFFEKINKTDKPLSRLIKKKNRVPKHIKAEMREVMTDTKEIQRSIRNY